MPGGLVTHISTDSAPQVVRSDRKVWSASTKPVTERQFADLRVLVVDDNWFAISLLRNVLQALGIWKTEACVNAVDGFKQLGKEKFDLILLDNNMPGLSGTEFTKQLRAMNSSPNRSVPILMISSCTEMNEVKKALDVGVHEYLAKPFAVAGLLKKITSCLSTPRAFICRETYAGPCRRRQTLALKNRGRERRNGGVSAVGGRPSLRQGHA